LDFINDEYGITCFCKSAGLLPFVAKPFYGNKVRVVRTDEMPLNRQQFKSLNNSGCFTRLPWTDNNLNEFFRFF